LDNNSKKESNNLKELREFYEKRGRIRKTHSDRSYDTLTHDLLVEKNISTGNIALDLGCGDGYYLKNLIDKFNMVIGIDISRSYIKQAKKESQHNNVYLIVADACKIPIRDDTLDFILCSETIEHLTKPHETISEIRRTLHIEGKMLMTTPNRLEPTRILLYSFTNILSKIFGLSSATYIKLSILLIHNKLLRQATQTEKLSLKYSTPDHFHCFSAKKLTGLCTQIGLTPLRIDYSMHHQIISPIAYLTNRFPQLMILCFKIGKIIPKDTATVFALICTKIDQESCYR